MAMNPSTMEMKMVLAMVTRCIQYVEAAEEGLAVMRRDLAGQADWIKGEIRKASEDPKALEDRSLLWEQMKAHRHGEMGPAFIFVKDIEHLFKP